MSYSHRPLPSSVLRSGAVRLRLCLGLLTSGGGVGAPTVLAAEPAQLERHVIREAGHPQVFELAPGELHVTDREKRQRLQRMGRARTGEALRAEAAALAASSGADVGLVLYPQGAARTEWTRRVLTRRVVVQLAPGTDAGALATQVGATAGPELSYAPGYRLFQVRAVDGALAVAAALRGRPGVVSAEPILARQRRPRLTPNDPLYPQQWTLNNTGQQGALAGVDVNVAPVWDTYRGQGINIAVVDDGLLYTHPDLADNCDVAHSYDFRDNDPDPKPEGEAGATEEGKPKADSHGTATAGVIAARGNNALGAVGPAFEAKLIGARLIGGSVGDDQEAAAIAHRLNLVHISNNSWGGDDDGNSKGGAGPLILKALEHGATTGRGGKGVIYVWAAGNGGAAGDNANYDTYVNSIYTIAVGALNDLGQRADYSEPGANVVIVTPSGHDATRPQGTTTTDLLGEFGYNRSGADDELSDLDYTQKYNGTSAAAPLASGVIALMLQANPQLGWRDVQEVLMRSATQVSPNDPDWITNRAGLRFNHHFGAGLVNADAAVRLALTWTNLPAHTHVAAEQTGLTLPIPDDQAAGVTRSFDFSASALRVEHVVVGLAAQHPMRGDLEVTLTSPAGTVSRLAELHGDTNAHYAAHTFMSVFNWGESSQGTWTVRVADRRAEHVGTLTDLALMVYGTPKAVPPAGDLKLTPLGFVGGHFTVQVTGQAGVAYTLQGSADLSGWETVATATPAEGTFTLADPASAPGSRRFYRVVR